MRRSSPLDIFSMRSIAQVAMDGTSYSSRIIRQRCTFAVVSTVVVLIAVPPARTFVLTPIMSSPSKGKCARTNRIGRSSPFEVVSSSGSTVQAALQALRESYALEDISSERSARDTSSSLGLVFYTRFERDRSRDFLHDVTIREELGMLHGALPWVGHMIASPALATSTAEHGEEDGDFDPEEPSCYVTMVLLDNPGMKVTPFVFNPDCQLPPSSPLLQDEEDLGLAVVEALKSCASDAKTSFDDCSTGQFDALCLAYGVDSAAGKSDSAIKLRRLNEILRGARLSRREDPRRCPLIASVTSDTSTATYVSTRNGETGELRTVAAGLAGAVVYRRSGSMSRFQVVHAGNHASIRGSQFRIKRMQGSKIAEVTPVRSLTGEELKLNCGAGVASAAEWCRHTVFSSSRFEKMAMQAALGVGILRRMVPGMTHGACPPHAVGDNHGVIPCLPAETCIDITKVGASGSLNLMMPSSCAASSNGETGYGWRSSETEEGPTVRGLQSGDLCDFRTVGPLASLQAERDAFAWFHATRLGASMAQGHAGAESRAIQNIQGCLAASAASRFADGFEKESCDAVARLTADHGLCHSACLVPSRQIVSMDNEMTTCTPNACLACVYVCGEE